MSIAARITGTGSAFPEKRLTNDELVEKLAGLGVETSNQWIFERTGSATQFALIGRSVEAKAK